MHTNHFKKYNKFRLPSTFCFSSDTKNLRDNLFKQIKIFYNTFDVEQLSISPNNPYVYYDGVFFLNKTSNKTLLCIEGNKKTIELTEKIKFIPSPSNIIENKLYNIYSVIIHNTFQNKIDLSAREIEVNNLVNFLNQFNNLVFIKIDNDHVNWKMENYKLISKWDNKIRFKLKNRNAKEFVSIINLNWDIHKSNAYWLYQEYRDSLPINENSYWRYDGYFIVDKLYSHGVYYPKGKPDNGTLTIPFDCKILDYFDSLVLSNLSDTIPLSKVSSFTKSITKIVVPISFNAEKLFSKQYINSNIDGLRKFIAGKVDSIQIGKKLFSTPSDKEKAKLLLGDTLLAIFLHQFPNLNKVEFTKPSMYYFENGVVYNIVSCSVVLILNKNFVLRRKMPYELSEHEIKTIQAIQRVNYDNLVDAITQRNNASLLELLYTDESFANTILNSDREGDYYKTINGLCWDKRKNEWGYFPQRSGNDLKIPKDCKILDYVDCSDNLKNITSITFPPDFNFSKLMHFNGNENKFQRPEKSNNVSIATYIHPILDNNKSLASDYIFNDSPLFKFLNLFENLKEVKFDINCILFESIGGAIVFKPTKKIIYRISHNNNLYININVDISAKDLGSQIYEDCNIIFDKNSFSKYASDIRMFSTANNVFIPVKYMASYDYSDVANVYGYGSGLDSIKSNLPNIKPVEIDLTLPVMPFENATKYYIQQKIVTQSPKPNKIVPDVNSKKTQANKNTTMVNTVCCPYDEVVSVMNTFPCINKGHNIYPVHLEVLYRDNKKGELKKIKVEAYYCNRCKHYFLYTTEFNSLRNYLNNKQYLFFAKFKENNKIYGSKYSMTDKSILNLAGYEVNQNSNLTQKERLNILLDLNRHGVKYHVLVSYLNTFINYNGAATNRNMQSAVSAWKSDLIELKKLYLSKIVK